MKKIVFISLFFYFGLSAMRSPLMLRGESAEVKAARVVLNYKGPLKSTPITEAWRKAREGELTREQKSRVHQAYKTLLSHRGQRTAR